MSSLFDEKMMSECLNLAEKGRGRVSPNPLVGSVIVKDKEIIGRGFHQLFGGPHAEVNAAESVGNKELIKGATIYVNLEPCAHYGKTPPCAELLVKLGVKRVVVGCIDTFSKVQGKGVEILKKAGISVDLGVLEDKCVDLNKRFFHFHRFKAPYVILKWAQTQDGFIAPEKQEKREPFWITGDASKRLVHKWRVEEDAIMVGTRTAIKDNPSLTARLVEGPNPTRVVIDKNLRIPKSSSLLSGEVQTFIFTESEESPNRDNLSYVKAPFDNEKLIPFVLSFLYEKGIQSLIVEGGPFLLNSFLKLNIWNEARVLVGPKCLKSGLKAPSVEDFGAPFSESEVGPDRLMCFRP